MGFPAWFYGPNGEAAIFNVADEIPAGWADAPCKAPIHPLDRDRNGTKGAAMKRRRR